MIVNAVAGRPARAKPRAEARRSAKPDGEALHAIEANEVRDAAGGERECLRSPEGLRANQRPGLLLHPSHLGISDRANVEGERVENAAAEVEGVGHGPRCDDDLRAAEELRREPDVHLVVANFPATADDPAHRIVEPRPAAADLQLLPGGEPEASAHEAVLHDHEQVFQRVIAESGAREVERHPHDLRVVRIDVDRADDSRLTIVLRTDLHLEHLDGASGQLEAERVRGDREVVGREPLRRQRMRHVDHLISVAEPDDGGEIILDDAEVVAVIRDVGGEQQRVATPHDVLLAEVGRAPVNFIHELIRLHDLRRLGQPFADLRQKGDVAVRDGLVVLQSGVGELLRTSRGGSFHEGAAARVVPFLRTGNAWRESHQPETACGNSRGEAMHR